MTLPPGHWAKTGEREVVRSFGTALVRDTFERGQDGRLLRTTCHAKVGNTWVEYPEGGNIPMEAFQ